MSTAVERRRYEITGRVQGVGFRYWATSRALRIGLSGTIHNRVDRAVEIEAQGTGEDLDRFEAWLAQGPPAAQVHALRRLPPLETALPQDFRVIQA